ncbi:EAL domain-containing protein [Pseudomonas sp.]|uniref:putative bifunctional diguanylate cyclase/phosphodiesterase n=1 Tax=Pseudomonas sp. TaxID=306 RepID=UPI00260071EF|nr:EAL domain-containing protein [Pseudomonas sp.]
MLINEGERLAALDEYQLVEDDSTLKLDAIVELASKLFDVPTVLVSIVERDRQFFTARKGLEVCETGRDVSFCAHALERDDMLVVPDAKLDARFAQNPLVLGAPFIRFYAGMPLRAPSGHVLGTLCIIDQRPRNGLSSTDREHLNALATLVLDKLEVRRLAVAHRAGQSRFEQIAATSPDGIVCANHQGRITFWNSACERLFGFDAAQAVGASIDLIVPPRMRGGHGGGLKRVAAGGAPRLVGTTVELEAAHQSGHEFPIELSLSMWQEEGNASFGAIVRDITTRRADEERLFQLAHIDSLSGLPNRGVLMSRIAECLERKAPFALLMLDLDGFKDVNDTLGHHAGDQVVREIAQRLLSCVKAIDTVARLGGDEFAILMPEDATLTRIEHIAQSTLKAIAEPLHIEEQLSQVTASMGIAMYPTDGGEVGDLLSAADLAMYQAKASGRNCVRFFSAHLKDKVRTRRALEGEIRRAIEQQEFELFYQPQIRVSDQALVGLEALLRWRHPKEGLLPPIRFIAAIESGAFAAEVGHWVMRTACAYAVELRKVLPALTMGVNLFGAQFQSGQLAKQVLRVLEETGLPPEALEIEITENIILAHDELVLEPLRVLHQLGVGIAFDDFGTGYASLSLLKRYPLTRLKIDRSFITEICEDEADAAIVKAVIFLAEKLHLQVIAEGVETAEQRDFLRVCGCQHVQGYLYGKPMAVPDLENFIQQKLLGG